MSGNYELATAVRQDFSEAEFMTKDMEHLGVAAQCFILGKKPDLETAQKLVERAIRNAELAGESLARAKERLAHARLA